MWAPQMGFPMNVCRKGAVCREGDYRQSLGGGASAFRGRSE